VCTGNIVFGLIDLSSNSGSRNRTEMWWRLNQLMGYPKATWISTNNIKTAV
jgi:hypothetical protein